MSTFYLDHAATTPCSPAVWAAMEPYFVSEFANANSIHTMGRSARQALVEARSAIAGVLGCEEAEIVLTSGASEANNLAIRGATHAGRARGRRILTTRIEHAAVLAACRELEAERFVIDFVEIDRWGRVLPEQVAEAVSDDTILLTLAHANNEIGTVQRIMEIVRAVKARREDVLIHVDAVQSVGHIPVDVSAWGADLVSFTAHKFYGPKGIGGLFVKEGVQIEPLIAGGGQERGIRAGTESVGLAVGMAAALSLATRDINAEAAFWTPLRDELTARLLEIPESHLNGHPTERLPSIVNVSFLGVDGEDLVHRLDREGIYTSTGAACSTGRVEPSHVLTALGLPRLWALGAVRFSLGAAARNVDVTEVARQTAKMVEHLRSTHRVPRRRLAVMTGR